MTIKELAADEIMAQHAIDVSRLMTELAAAPRAISTDELQVVARENHLFVAIGERGVIGLVCLVPMRLPQGVRLWIESVIVAKAERRRGLGRRLLEAALARAADYGDAPVSLTSNPTRQEAHRLFRTLGFTIADTSVFRRPASP